MDELNGFFFRIAMDAVRKDKDYAYYMEKLDEMGIRMTESGMWKDDEGNYLEDSYIRELLLEK